MGDREQSRPCELAWLEPQQDERGCLVVGSSAFLTSECSLVLDSVEAIIKHLREVSRKVYEWCEYWVAVSLDGLSEPALYAAVVGERWHFWYLAEGGCVSFRSVGDPNETGFSTVIFSDFDEVPNAELVHNDVGERVVREWVESKRLSDAITWREG